MHNKGLQYTVRVSEPKPGRFPMTREIADQQSFEKALYATGGEKAVPRLSSTRPNSPTQCDLPRFGDRPALTHAEA